MSTTPTFAEAKGLESNQAAKALAKEKSLQAAKNKQDKSSWPIFYTDKGGKVIELTFKPKGCYSNFLGNLKSKKEKANLDGLITKWKSEGKFLYSHEIDGAYAKYQAELKAKVEAEEAKALEKEVSQELQKEDLMAAKKAAREATKAAIAKAEAAKG